MTLEKDALEQLSEFIDGQGQREPGVFFAKRLSADAELQATWSRYHVIRECVRHRGVHIQASHLQNRVAMAIAAEPEPGSKIFSARPDWLRPVVGLAITCVVAITAVLGVQNRTAVVSPENGLQTVATQFVPFRTPQSNGLDPVNYRAVPASFRDENGQSRSPKVNQRLNAYLLRHSQVAARAGRSGIIYLAPILSAQNSTASTQLQTRQEPLDETTADNIGKQQESPGSRPQK